MNKQTIDFLIAQYGQRIDFPQPIVNTDDETIQNQLTLVNKRITLTKLGGLLWTVIGVFWIIMSSISIATESLSAIQLFNTGLDIFYIVLGLFLLIKVADLKKKKVILETILFVNKVEG